MDAVVFQLLPVSLAIILDSNSVAAQVEYNAGKKEDTQGQNLTVRAFPSRGVCWSSWSKTGIFLVDGKRIKDSRQTDHQYAVFQARRLEVPQFLGSQAQIEVDGVQFAVLDALPAEDAVPVVVNQKGMAEHRAADRVLVAIVAQLLDAAVHAHMSVGPQFENGRHGKQRVDCTQRADIPAPDPAFKKHAEKKCTERDGEDDPGGQSRRRIGIPGGFDPEQEDAETGHYPAGILSDYLRGRPFGLEDLLRQPAGHGQTADTAPGTGKEKEGENQQRPADHPAEGQADIFLPG